jgi:hypothetical protein
MTSSPRSDFTESRVRAERELTDQRRKAVRTVADHARDETEFTAMVSMLGLSDASHNQQQLGRWLGVYVSEVAAAVGVPTEATGCEVTDTATAYIGLDQRWFAHPDHNLMLVWDEHFGWRVAVETTPAEAGVVIAYLDSDIVPSPAAVAEFVGEAAAGRCLPHNRRVPTPSDRAALAVRMSVVCPVTT